MSPEAIDKWHMTPTRYRCHVCRQSLRPTFVRVPRGVRVRCECHGSVDEFFVGDAYVEDAGRRIMWRFALDPRHEFHASKIDRHGRAIDVEYQDFSGSAIYGETDTTGGES